MAEGPQVTGPHKPEPFQALEVESSDVESAIQMVERFKTAKFYMMVWTLCGPKPEGAGRGEAGDLQLSGIHAYLREEPARKVHGATADDPQADAGQAQGH
jgi:hypothetical protein